jgi:hypothetical protein
MSDESEIDWPDDLRCIKCGAVVGEDGVKIEYASPARVEPELYAWCETHSPDSDKEEELWQRVKKGELREQAQLWGDY